MLRATSRAICRHFAGRRRAHSCLAMRTQRERPVLTSPLGRARIVCSGGDMTAGDRWWTAEVASFLAGVVLFTAFTWTFASKAEAASSTCGTGGSYFVGVQLAVQQSSNGDGVQSNVENRFPLLCTSTSAERFSLGTVMISRPDGTGWAQIGSIRNTTLCCHRFFWQWTRGTGFSVSTAYWGDPVLHQNTNFKVTRLAADGHLHMIYLNPDQTPPCNQAGFCPETDFDPSQSWGGQHLTAFAEVSHPGNDVNGSASAKADFASILVRPLGGGWQDPSTWSTFNDRPCYYHRGTVSQYTFFRTWTDPINHGTQC